MNRKLKIAMLAASLSGLAVMLGGGPFPPF
jgi:hypothetical protein